MADISPNQAAAASTEAQGLGEQAAGQAPASMQAQIQKALMDNRRLLMLIAGTLMLAGFLSLILWTSETPYRSVYSGTSEKDAAAIVDILQKEHIPYKLEGSTVLVPSEKVYAARLKLASEDVMPGVGTGFEIFDRAGEFGMSDFTQKVNLQRALQGELARTIEVLPQITAARVHLVMPKTSAFAERDRKASASVMLQVIGGKRLSRENVTAIQNLVAASIPELDKADVTVVDSSGNLLTSKDQQGGMGQGQDMDSYQVDLEKRLTLRLKTMLEQVVGEGQAVVRVSATINREYVEQNSKKFNPDEQVLRSQKTNEEKRTSSQGMPQGVPGVASNTPGQAPQAGTQGSQETASKREVVNNYEISSTSEHKIIPFGSIQRLSVAVIVGGHYKTADDGTKTFVPRSKAELKSLRLLAQRAVGYDEDRGDLVELQSMPLLDFSNHDDEDALKAEEAKAFYFEMARYGLAGLALFLVAWFVLRPLAQRIAPDKKDALAGATGGHVDVVAGGSVDDLSDIDRVRLAVSKEPERAEKVLREWVGTSS